MRSDFVCSVWVWSITSTLVCMFFKSHVGDFHSEINLRHERKKNCQAPASHALEPFSNPCFSPPSSDTNTIPPFGTDPPPRAPPESGPQAHPDHSPQASGPAVSGSSHIGITFGGTALLTAACFWTSFQLIILLMFSELVNRCQAYRGGLFLSCCACSRRPQRANGTGNVTSSRDIRPKDLRILRHSFTWQPLICASRLWQSATTASFRSLHRLLIPKFNTLQQHPLALCRCPHSFWWAQSQGPTDFWDA